MSLFENFRECFFMLVWLGHLVKYTEEVLFFNCLKRIFVYTFSFFIYTFSFKDTVMDYMEQERERGY
jgi:hypothetical protein